MPSHCLARLSRVAALLALLAILLASAASPAAARLFNAESFTLENGLQVVVITSRRAPVVTQMVFYKVGGADEAPGKSGLAHFLEHLMFRGTKAVGPGQFSAIVSRLGGEENAFTTADYTAFYQSVAVEALPRVMELEADRMVNLALTPEIVDTERKVILEERRQRVDNDPGARLSEMLNAVLYLNHPYRIPVIGWEHEMEGLTQDDAVAFYRQWYAPDNAVLVLAGDISAAEARPLVEKYYGPIPARAVPVRHRTLEPQQFAPRRVQLESARVQQPSWVRSYQAPSYAGPGREHAYALEVLAQILGGDTTGRLYRRLVVEQKVAAGASAHYNGDRLDLGTFSFSATPRPGGKLEAIEAAIDKEIADLLAGGVTDEEVARAKAALLADAVKARDSLSGPANMMGVALTTGLTVDDVESWPERIGAVTRADVEAAAKAVLDINRSATGLLLPKETS
ncbi:MAG: M16 family metallopeptidase [Pseudomonadota bacterium]